MLPKWYKTFLIQFRWHLCTQVQQTRSGIFNYCSGCEKVDFLSFFFSLRYYTIAWDEHFTLIAIFKACGRFVVWCGGSIQRQPNITHMTLPNSLRWCDCMYSHKTKKCVWGVFSPLCRFIFWYAMCANSPNLVRNKTQTNHWNDKSDKYVNTFHNIYACKRTMNSTKWLTNIVNILWWWIQIFLVHHDSDGWHSFFYHQH